MKSCPTCKRTFDDQMSFCLVDGSILSAPFDHRSTPHHHEDNQTHREENPAPTRILNPTAPDSFNTDNVPAPTQSASLKETSQPRQVPDTTQSENESRTTQTRDNLEATRNVSALPSTRSTQELESTPPTSVPPTTQTPTPEPTRPPQGYVASASLPQTTAAAGPSAPATSEAEQSTSAAVSESQPPAAGSHAAMKTIMAPPPEIIAGSSPRAAARETQPAIDSNGARLGGGKRIAAAVTGLLAVITVVAAVVWIIHSRKTPTAAATVKTDSVTASNTDQKALPISKSFIENANETEIKMISIPSGKFLMGSPDSEAGRDADEGPQSDETVQSFYMSIYEVTQAQYKAVMGTNPSSFKGEDLPVDGVSWNNAIEFCQKLSASTGRAYRLPTEAEWEYAARAGSTGPYAGNVEALAWYDNNASSRTHPVGQKQANRFGLYDMNGNVWEWCQSKYKPYPYNATDGRENVGDKDVRVARGGSWKSAAKGCRSAYRRRVPPDPNTVGFRIVMVAK